MARTDERRVVAQIKRALNSLPCCMVRKRKPYISGDPDLTGSYHGKRIEIEVKALGGKISPLQIKRLKVWTELGCIAGVAWCLEDAIDLMWDYLTPEDKKTLAKHVPELV